MTSAAADIARRLALAWQHGQALDPAEVAVTDAAGAAAVQRALWQALAPTLTTPMARKVGSAGPASPITCAPLPGVLSTGSALAGPVFQRRGIELELALQLARDIDDPERLARAGSAAACIASVHAALEVVESRIAGWPQVPAWAKLADLQSHGALVLGDAADWRPADGLPRLQGLAATLDVDGARVAGTVGGHPAPDLCRLLAALAQQAVGQGWPLRAGTVITTGSCTGMVFVGPLARVSGRLSMAPAVSLSFAA